MPSPVRFPPPLRTGARIAVTAPSSGVQADCTPRLDLVLDHLRAQGYEVIEGECVRGEYKDASGSAAARARDLLRFLLDPTVDAILPPWGGELATELLEALDFDRLRTVSPKWILGYSDVSTLLMPLTLCSGWVTAQGPNLMDLAPTQTDALTCGALTVLGTLPGTSVTQHASTMHQRTWIDFSEQVDAPLHLTETTRWWRLDGHHESVTFEGRLIGGCLDTVAWLAGTRYGDLPAFRKACGDDAVVLHLENVEFGPGALVRALTALRRHGWFDDLSGLLVGRSTGPDAGDPQRLSYVDALHAVLGHLRIPVLCDVDIGHRPPQFTLLNGARASVTFRDGMGTLTQWID